jgi:hypothetical protein
MANAKGSGVEPESFFVVELGVIAYSFFALLIAACIIAAIRL